MAGSLRDQRGGIRSLSRIVAEHGGAVRYELLRVGLRLDNLGTTKCSWVDLLAVYQNAPLGNAIAVAIHGDRAHWHVGEELLAAAVNALRTANWQRQGDEHATRPELILPPGTDDESDTQGYGSGAIPISEFDTFWDAPTPAPADE
jgi:hypothetical protein